MNKIRILTALAVFAAAALPATAKDIYLLLGQSNMAGRGVLGHFERLSTERVEKLDKQDRWVEAVEPLHFDKPSAGGGLGASFARVVADHNPSETVGLVPCAVGGSALDAWMPGAKLYAEAVRRAKIAQKAGPIKALLWHQGESDADQGPLQASYNARLAKMVAALRAELGLDAAKVPFVYGAIGEFRHASYYEGNKALNAVMRNAVKDIPNSHWVEAADLRCNGDMIHFDLQSLRLLGERYARAYLRATKRQPVWLTNVYSDHMLFQCDQPIVLAGESVPGAEVTVALDATAAKATAGEDGRWEATLPARKAGGPFVITVKTADDQVRLRDVLSGELWLCSGQSNMEMPVWGLACDNEFYHLPDGRELAAAAKDGELRLLRVPQGLDPDRPAADTFGSAGWARADSAAPVKPFSAAGYHFGLALRKKLGVPVGLVEAAWGGTRIEPWIPGPALKQANLAAALADLDYARTYQPVVKGETVVPRALKDKLIKLQGWVQKVERLGPEMYRNKEGSKMFWNEIHRPDSPSLAFDPTCGLVLKEPAFVWYRWIFFVREEPCEDPDMNLEDETEPSDGDIEIPAHVEDLAFEADTIVDTDTAWFDGAKIGATDIGTHYYWGRKRHYGIRTPGPGRHVLSIRVYNHFGEGGFRRPRLVWKRGKIDLEKKKFQALVWSKPNKSTGPRPPSPWGSDWEQIDPHGLNTVPTTLYDRMIAPLAPFRFRGAIWYQGCSNTGDWKNYAACQKALVAGWRETFRRPDLAFVCVELAGYQMHRPKNPIPEAEIAAWEPQENGYVFLRAEQEKIREVPGCECASAVDIGEPSDIHPKDKKTVGERLAACAENLCYGGKAKVRGPKAVKAVRDGKAVVVTFDEPLVVKGGAFAPHEFTLAGSDGRRVWAKATLSGPDAVRVESDVAEPVAVDWGRVPYAPKLSIFNREGFPATPFKIADVK